MAGKTVPQPIVPPSEKQSLPPYPEEYSGDMGGIQIQDAPNSSPIADFTSTEPKPLNTDIATSADAAKPINHFSQTAYAQNQGMGQNIAMPIGHGGFGYGGYGYGLQSTNADKPTDYLSPQARQMVGYGNSALGGVAAGGQVAPTADAGDALLQVAGAGLGGAAAGLATGNPLGAAIGGITGLVAGGINAFVGTSAARKQQRQQDKIRRDIQARDEARYQQARRDQQKYFDVERGDNLEKERYNRRLTAAQSQWAAQDRARSALNDVIAQDANFKHMLVGDLR